MRWTFPTMGTVASVSVPGDPIDPALAAAVEAEFLDHETEFSRFLPDSAISRIARGELSLIDASERMRNAYAVALDWRSRTSGAFTPHRPDGIVDLDGVVKALAIQRAGELLAEAGVADWCLGCGGDVLRAGQAMPGSAWTIGIADPDRPRSLLAEVPLSGDDLAIATSGTSERGEHVWRSDDASSLRQVTVIARDIVTADVLATAILSGGRGALDELARGNGVEVLALGAEGLLVTPRLRSLIAPREHADAS